MGKNDYSKIISFNVEKVTANNINLIIILKQHFGICIEGQFLCRKIGTKNVYILWNKR